MNILRQTQIKNLVLFKTQRKTNIQSRSMKQDFKKDQNRTLMAIPCFVVEGK